MHNKRSRLIIFFAMTIVTLLHFLVYSCDQTNQSTEQKLKKEFPLLSQYMPESISIKFARETIRHNRLLHEGNKQWQACKELESILEQQTQTTDPVLPLFAQPTLIGRIMPRTGLIHELITDFITGKSQKEEAIRNTIGVITNGAWLFDFDEESGILAHIKSIDEEMEFFIDAGIAIQQEQAMKILALSEQE